MSWSRGVRHRHEGSAGKSYANNDVSQMYLQFCNSHWSLRPVFAEFADVTQGINCSILKISRQNNKVADKLAKMARQASIPTSCLFSCNALSHNLHCPVRDALANLQWGNFALISVTCL
ncbi:hypothetical protein PVAP13_6NG138209 [Panicum virgatum]|uniref:Uncharacterized protein n=1 Tax=Panicum virgatum TaxID=38727 RepID=A0A8T0R0R7_PANVG|nr:hypothetical protein PVAP13_6NG138209 [Panicum virgatum]